MFDNLNNLDDEIKQEEQLYLEERKKMNSSKKDGTNEFGDKITKSDACAGGIFWIGFISLAVCACLRGCQEIKKHREKSASQAQQQRVIQNAAMIRN